MGKRPVANCLFTLSIQALSFSSVAYAELAPEPNQTILNADKILISPAEKTFAFDVDLSYNSNLLPSNELDYKAESFVALSTRYQISERLDLEAQIGVKQIYDSATNEESAHGTDFSNAQARLNYSASPSGADIDLSYNVFTYLPSSATDRANTGYEGGFGLGVDVGKRFALPGLDQPGAIVYSFSALKNLYSGDFDILQRSNMSFRFRHSLRYSQRLSRRFSFILSSYLQNAYAFDGGQHAFFQLSELLSYNSSRNLSFYVGHTNEADALEDNGIDTNFSLYDANDSYFVSGARISF